MIELLASLIIAVTWAGEPQDPPMVKAVNDGSVADVKLLAKKSNELNKADQFGYDGIFYSVSLNELPKFKVLVKAGAPVDKLYSEKKESLLFEATRLGADDIVREILRIKPSLLQLKNADGETVVFEAVRSDESQLVKLFVKKGLSLAEKNKAGKTPVDYLNPQNEKMKAVFKQFQTN